MRRVLAVVACLAVFVPSTARAAAIEWSTTVENSTTGTWSLGWEFDVLNPINVTALGVYDDFFDDLTESHEVGIYDSAASLLVSAIVNPGSFLSGHFRYVSVPGTLLAPGLDYRIASTTGSENYTWSPGGFVVDPNIAFVQSRYVASATLAYPTDVDVAVGMFGPNFEFETQATPVPEPASMLLVGTGLAGFVARRRRQQKG